MERFRIDDMLGMRQVRRDRARVIRAIQTAAGIAGISPPHFRGPDITVVLVDERNINPGGSRLVHTYMIHAPGGSPAFQANDDDRGAHDAEDEGVTWVRGHVSDDSPEGLALLAAAKLTDVE